jgi:chorismate synthase
LSSTASSRTGAGPVGPAVAKQILLREGIEVYGHVIESHGIKAKPLTFEEIKANYRKNHLNCCDLEAAEVMIEDILKVREMGETCGGVIEIIARGVPAGLGEPVFDKLRAAIGHGLSSIGAVTGIEFGDGFEAARVLGSEWNDLPYLDEKKNVRFRTNHAGGFLGGISNGEDLVVRLCCKPTPTVSVPQDSIDMAAVKEAKLAAITRRDITICPRIYPVAEAMIRMAIMDSLLMAKGLEQLTLIDEKYKRLSCTARERGEL